MRFEVFGKTGCAKCTSTKDKLNHLLAKVPADGASVLFIDVESIDGMAEGAFHDVHRVPTTILRSDDGEPLARWDGCIPPSVEVQSFLTAPRVQA
ncbi:MAG TPA: hypothetical protein VMY69_05400 [Phycisphaerae bacterium]|jgi:hypothetical protein|nr:hypothetical protein [Phycisphaerae bacterium]